VRAKVDLFVVHPILVIMYSQLSCYFSSNLFVGTKNTDFYQHVIKLPIQNITIQN